MEIIEDFSGGGKYLDFSGNKEYPFPFKIKFYSRELVLASKTNDERRAWVEGFKLLLEVKRKKIETDGEAFFEKIKEES